MNFFKNFSLYIPGDKSELTEIGIRFYRDENGNDWYDIQSQFSVDTLKIACDASGLIISASFDASALAPVGLSVAEIKKDAIPDDFFNSGRWVFDGKKITAYEYTTEELKQQAESKKRQLLDDATETIAPLQDAADLDMATDEEIALLTAWKKYRVLLNRVDTSVAPDIAWPEVPQ
ncbi:tail fiber assembly protein [Mixta intestinalis]|uniref:Tail fiber assembly protein n=1 Tax=Mixta intestinalis TaxID=1615494 RepID=A0A6P1Q4F9_9GAMM|nr:MULTISPECIES: tail fiber assembly protein [Mixta]QHM72949.1 hypothetical protein C7M51_03290 [Mixta intestinalis]QHM77704.1 hypothetical protein C7M52_03707 [Mixta theicola]